MPELRSVLVTGAAGFVGSGVTFELLRRRYPVVGSVRDVAGKSMANLVSSGPISGKTDWSEALVSKDVVIHCAARAHVMNDRESDPLEVFREVNVRGTLSLARQAATAGVQRFIFVSSVKVNGEQTLEGQAFFSNDSPFPEDSYGISKHEAEVGLRELAAKTGMEVVIVRPPLVYGPGVKGNFASMINLVWKGVPLPLGAVHNKRSLVALDNLIDLIITCISHPNAANETFLVSDGEDLSTTQLLRGVAKAMGKSSRLIPIPEGVLQFGATLLGKKSVAQRLLGSLQVDISYTQNCLNWAPPLTVTRGLQRCFTNQQD